MQKVALRARLRRIEGDFELALHIAALERAAAHDLDRRLRLARAGLLIALPHVSAPAARLLVGYALEWSGESDAELAGPLAD